MRIRISEDIIVNLYLLILLVSSYLLYNTLNIYLRVDLVLVSIFFFAMFDRYSPNLFILIFLGLLQDINALSLMGSTSLQYVLIWAMARDNSNSLNKQRFTVVWATFITIFMIALLIETMLTYLTQGNNIIDYQYSLSTVATILFYPLIHNIYAVTLLKK